MATNQTVLWEEIWKRTAKSKTFALADGSKQAVIFMGDVHYQDLNGFYQDIDTALNDEADLDQWDFPINKHTVDNFNAARDKATADKKANKLNHDNYDFQTLRVPFASKIPRNWMRGYTIGHDTDKLTFKPVGASPSMGLVCDDANNTIRYQDAWNDTDVCLAISERGIKETLTLKTDKAPKAFTFEIVGTIADDLTAGTLTLQPAWLEDSVGVKRDVTQTLRRETNGVFLDLVADVTGLTFPVEIDPTISTGSNTDWAYVYSGNPTGNFNKPATTYIGMNGTYQYRAFQKFNIGSIPAGSSIISASFTYGFQNVVNAGAVGLYVYEVASALDFAAVTWNTQPSGATLYNSKAWQSTDGAQNYTFTGFGPCVQKWVDGTLANNGVTFQAPYDGNYLAINGSGSSLSIIYNVPPTAPVVTYPNGGETLNASHTIAWTPATDTETPQASLQYNIDVSTDSGATWAQVVALTVTGATSYAYDFSAIAQSSTCLIRIRAYDGSIYGAYDQSNGVFTIQHNLAPTAPTLLAPDGGSPRDRAQVIRLSWQHNDPNSPDPQSKFDLQYSINGGTNWTTVTQVTTNQYYDVPANTFPHGNVVWKVRTYDQAGLSGPYSAQATFLAGDKPSSATIISPIGTVALARPTVQWSSAGQIAYQVQTLDAGNATVYDSGMLNSINKAHTIGTNLANGENYTNKVIIQNVDSLASDPASAAISVSYTPPATPTIIATAQTGYIELSIVNPVPSGTEPNVSSNDLYRRKVGESSWTRIVTGILASGTYHDYATASGVTYEYYVRAQGDNSTFSDSALVSSLITLKSVWLHDVTDPEGTVHQFMFDDGRSNSWKPEVTMMGYAGRKRAVAEFGELDESNISVKLKILEESGDMAALEALAYSKPTVCFRDSRGRKMFGIIPQLAPSDEWYGNTVPLNVTEIDYSEVV